MKYSHAEDNKDNGFADIVSRRPVNPSEYIGKITLNRTHLFQPGNFVNVMIEGSDNDVKVTLHILYDLDNDKRYDKNKDAALVTEPVSMDFTGWKELKIRLDQDNFKLVAASNVGFEVTEDEAVGIQLEFESGSSFKPGVFKSGIALVSEIPNREAIEESETDGKSGESYFQASNSPNPFNSSTVIRYVLPSSTNVTITVYDRLGRAIEEIVNRSQEAGENTVQFDAGDLPSGIYFYRIKTPERTEVRKMIISK